MLSVPFSLSGIRKLRDHAAFRWRKEITRCMLRMFKSSEHSNRAMNASGAFFEAYLMRSHWASSDGPVGLIARLQSPSLCIVTYEEACTLRTHWGSSVSSR